MRSDDNSSVTQSQLAHHGIKGMHWGIRRFQNEDGSYTSAGKKRYGVVESSNDPATKILRRQQENSNNDRQAKAIAKEVTAINSRRYRKAVKERDKLADDADRKASIFSNRAKSAKAEHENLKKEGESNFIKRQKSYMDYEMSDDDFKAVYGMSLKSYYKEELSRTERAQKSSIQTAKAYIKYRDDLMSMNLSRASKKDVTKQAKRLLSDALNSAHDEEDDD